MIRIALCALLAFSPPAAAQYPERPVTLLAGYPPGGLVDVVARLVAEGVKAKFPKGIAVVNRPGAAGAGAGAELVRSQPDGYTVVLTPASALVGGHIEALVAQPGELKGQVDGKRMRVLVAFQPQRHPVFPDVPTAKELGWDVANGVWYLLMAPKKTPQQVVKYLHDAAKAAIKDPQFAGTMAARGIDVDYRPGETLRADLWREYRLHTDILRRIGMLKQ